MRFKMPPIKIEFKTPFMRYKEDTQVDRVPVSQSLSRLKSDTDKIDKQIKVS